VPNPSDNALWQARARLGVAPLRWLFDLLRGSAATAAASGVYWCGLLVCAIDGTTMTVPDGARNVAAYTKQAGNHGGSGYPLLRLVALVACGTRSIIDAVFGPTSCGEQDYTRALARSLHAGMIVLADRNFDTASLIGELAATEAHVLVRVKSNRKLPVLARYADGSYLSTIGVTRVRVVECEITIATTAGRRTGLYRLATTLTDHRRYRASALITLYHERWEVETCYLELKSKDQYRGAVLAAAPSHTPNRTGPRRLDQPDRTGLDDLLRGVLPISPLSPPGTHQRLPAAVGPSKVQTAAEQQESPESVEQSDPETTGCLRPLGLGHPRSHRLVTRATRAV
jgi:hypothetical protein